ncbi:hypothetical protein [Frankia sp. AvcI1]|uniref:hypothetical protein n=1 Tax=Frankia sp. AvcI1 TaxID=573496 RepID=UPI0006EC100E|nr:hypothetical protein [Frankia sp. AvcI1]
MAVPDLGTPEKSRLLALMALGGAASNAELRERGALPLEGEPRRRVNELGLVTSVKKGRLLHHELTEAGWRWCDEELSAAAPARTQPLGRAFYLVLPVIRRFLDRADLSLADFVSLEAIPQFGPTGEAAAIEGGSVPAVADLETRIRDAYWLLAATPGDWVQLTAVRGRLSGLSRGAVDATLQTMERSPDVHIVPEADQRSLTEADRDAAIRIGGKYKHLLSISAR